MRAQPQILTQATSVYTDIAQIVAAASAAVGLFLVWLQVRKQTTQHFSDRVLDLYHELDTNEAREERRFVYMDFPKVEKSDEGASG